jgi:hypothetical protein
MSWLNPSALFALAAVAAPILIHILVQRRAERFPFPTLRFLQPTRLAAIRRHLLEDPALLAIRTGVLAAAVAALAGPLLVTSARRQLWDSRLVRAIVVDADATTAGTALPSRDDGPAAMLQQRFEGPSIPDGIRRAILWLETTPPARQEIVIASALPIGSVSQADVAAIPKSVGVRFVQSPTLPATRTAPGGRLLTSTGVRAREVTMSAERTSLRDVDVGDPAVWPIEVVSSPGDRPAIDAAVAAARSQRVWSASSDRRARLTLVAVDRPADVAAPLAPAGALANASPIQRPWMAGAVARMADDEDLRAAGIRVQRGIADKRFAAAPWQVLAVAADGLPLAAAAGSADRLLVVSAADATNLATPVLLRSIANNIATVPDLHRAEVMPIAGNVLQQWSRPPAPVVSPRIETVDHDDRRWMWLAALFLLALEQWIRRPRSAAAPQQQAGVNARVA